MMIFKYHNLRSIHKNALFFWIFFQPVVVATKHYKSKVHIVNFFEKVEPAGKPGVDRGIFLLFIFLTILQQSKYKPSDRLSSINEKVDYL